jgi:hypothetical protein
MLPLIIKYTISYQDEGGILEEFLRSEILRDHYKEDEFPWIVTPVSKENLITLIDEYAGSSGFTEDQRGDLVAWANRLFADGNQFIGIVDRE